MKHSIITKGLLLVLLNASCINLIGCQTSSDQKQKELELRQRELDLKERELEIQEKNTQTNKESNSGFTSRTNQPNSKKKELRYLFHANGGMIGYFDDGTFSTCPRCDFCRSNILPMFNSKPDGTYTVESDGSLIINNSDREFPNYQQDNGWALVDYHWNEKVPQF